LNHFLKLQGLCAAALLVAAGMSNSASALGLKESLAAAYNNNPTLQAARNQLRATDEQVPQARSNYFPTVTNNTTAGRDWLQQQAVFGVGATLNPREESLIVSEPVYRGGRTQAEIEKAENLVKAGREQLTVTEQNVLLAAATAYMDVYRDQAVLDLNINNEQVLRRQLEATQDQFRVGEVTRTDVSQAEARLAQATAARIQAEGTLNSSRAVYRNVTGITPTKLDAPEELQGLPGTADESIAASAQNPTVLFATFNEQAAQNDVDINFGELLPTLSVNGEYDHDDDTISKGSTLDNKALTAQLSVPLYPGSAVYSRVRAAKETVKQLRNQTNQAKQDAAQQATQAFESYTAALAQVKSFEKQIQANTIALEGVRQEATVGARTVLDILNAELELLNSQVSQVQAKHDTWVAGFQLKVAIGQLTAQAFEVPVQQYNVETHYNEVHDKLWGTGGDNH